MKAGNRYLAALCCIALASCGGGDSSPALTPTPTPSPSPSPTPTPTPTPTFNYTEFAELTGDQDFPTACVGYGLRGNGVPGLEGLHPFTIDGLIDYTAASQLWSVAVPNSLLETFGPSDLVSNSATRTLYEKSAGTGLTESFAIDRPSISGVAAQYGRLASYRLVEPTGFSTSAVCSFGVPTDPEDLPTTTTVAYSDLVVDGTVWEQQAGGVVISDIASGSGSVVGNVATGELTISLSYEKSAPGGTVTVTGPIEGTITADLSEERAGYSGLLNIGGSPAYQVSGGFYGPQGIETGFVFFASVDQDNDGQNEVFVVGRAYSRR